MSDRKTILSLRPFPRTANSLRLRSIWSRFRAASSETRKPVEYNVSIMARSRAPRRSPASTDSKSLSSSSRLRTSTVLVSVFESSIFSGARVLMSFFVRYLRKARKAMTW